MEEIYKNLSLENLEGEEWRNVVGYENYQVSNMGRVKSLANDKSRKEKILKQWKNKYGYMQVILCKDGKLKGFRVNRLVAIAFIPNPNNFRCVNHKDECKTNNCVDNLEWCTVAYNNTFGTRIARIVSKIDWKALGKKLTNRQDQSKRVYQYKKNGELVAIWQSTMECGRNGYNFGAVAACCRNCYMREGNNIYKNYIWSYTELIC